MKRQIRQGVFETNSSSTHVISIDNDIAILTDEEYQKYLKNEVIVTRCGEIYDVNDKEVKNSVIGTSLINTTVGTMTLR